MRPRSNSTNIAAWRRRRQPISAVCLPTSRPTRSCCATSRACRNPAPCRAGHVVARGGGQGALRPQSLFGQPPADRHASPRPRGRGACGPYPALGGRDLNKPVFRSMSEHFIRHVPAKMERPNRKHLMQNLSPRHVMTEESLRLGVESGWYSTKVSGTFVSGPHSSEADCLRRIAEINPPAAKKKGY